MLRRRRLGVARFLLADPSNEEFEMIQQWSLQLRSYVQKVVEEADDNTFKKLIAGVSSPLNVFRRQS
ncbi:hypothetical protein PAXRUDRAFT_834596 [Paxillus rubicundulus Ve08.2h10]|uniref:Uncharacterized protein n=1 Tax=Paxillus rubicundulus Ve08.2h10 TaxID=930991 RepID=A0A0D0C5E5_9AGAM|nr:hypothetical protein PAXRUDRAFT_834596 [Paxillus rubicundulus Ve08.2h10]